MCFKLIVDVLWACCGCAVSLLWVCRELVVNVFSACYGCVVSKLWVCCKLVVDVLWACCGYVDEQKKLTFKEIHFFPMKLVITTCNILFYSKIILVNTNIF